MLLNMDSVQHVNENGEERPIAFTSRRMNGVEKKYSQLEKEALAIRSIYMYMYGVKKLTRRNVY